ncbi:MAG: hypothetical protein MUE85_05940 [Microscillaceae bacterium]|jgi:hypothetical protein|nr:hypothetical protein [Microscillaceae bacterium]
MEVKINLAYEQVLEIVKQLPANQIHKLLTDAKIISESEKSTAKSSDFQKFLLSAPTMSDEQYEDFLKNRAKFNQWRTK